MKSRIPNMRVPRRKLPEKPDGAVSSGDDSFYYIQTREKNSSSVNPTYLTKLLLPIAGILIGVALFTPSDAWLTLSATCRSVAQWRATVFTAQYDYKAAQRLAEVNAGRYNCVFSRDIVPRRHNLSLEEFYDVYDGKWPVVITDVVRSWGAMHWSGEFLVKHYGKHKAFLKIVQGQLSQAEGIIAPLEHFYRRFPEGAPNNWAYVEDELFLHLHPHLAADAGNITYASEDLFEEFPQSLRPWSPMLLWGSAYSRSPLHVDPYNWTAFSAVLQGKKRWKLFPPGQDECLYVLRGQRCGYPLDCIKYNSAVDAFDPEYGRYPQYKKCRSLELEQLPGELLVIPTGWFHQAFNVEQTISLSSQMMNRNNYLHVVEEVFKAGTIPRAHLPSGWADMSPRKQVAHIATLFPQHIIDRGQRVTDEMIVQLKKT